MASPLRVPFLDLAAEGPAVGNAVRDAVTHVVASRQFVLGAHVEAFERAMAEYTGAPHAIGVGSGTDALVLAMAALGVGPGSVVLTTAFSFFATASTIVRLGARPLFADIDPVTFNIDPASAAKAIESVGEPVAGILPVHLFGRLADMEALRRLADRHGAWCIEDAAQAIGARSPAGMAGTLSGAGCLSFYPTKNLGGAGDGGMVLTADDTVAARIRRDRHQGQSAPYQHETIGLCSRLDALQAAALGAKLPSLDDWNARRRGVALAYDVRFRERGLAGTPDAPLVLPAQAGPAHVFHVYCVRARDRDALQAHLTARGIGTQVYYRTPLHRQPPLIPHALIPSPLVETERAAAEVLALPMYPGLTDDRIDLVVEAVAGFYRPGR